MCSTARIPAGTHNQAIATPYSLKACRACLHDPVAPHTYKGTMAAKAMMTKMVLRAVTARRVHQ